MLAERFPEYIRKEIKIKMINRCELVGLNFLSFLFWVKSLESTGLYVSFELFLILF